MRSFKEAKFLNVKTMEGHLSQKTIQHGWFLKKVDGYPIAASTKS
jgi:hypothetical protein